jgi:Reverse transcriptase (RNA-dependent DNA polymerase)
MSILNALLSKGYFPRELPPPFTTCGCASVLSDPKIILDSLLQEYQSRPVVYNLARAGSLRRKLSVLNPFSYLKLSRLVAEKWDDLEALASESPLSLTKPVLTNPDRAIERQTPLRDFPASKAAVRYAARYVLKTDVARFYHSIYTHSIPWAIYGKTTAKKNRSLSLWGNQLDKLIRDSQDGQTMGIPIGPDISLLIAEVLLSQIDQELVRRTGVRGLRYIDDYELSLNTLAEAEHVRGVLQELLGYYELALNGAKTSIESLPLPLQESWTSELGYFDLRTRQKGQHTDLLRYFDRAFALAAAYPSEGVLKYALGKAANLSVNPENRMFFQDLLLQSAAVEPGCLPMVLRVLCRFRAYELEVRAMLKQATSPLTERLFRRLHQPPAETAPTGDDSEKERQVVDSSLVDVAKLEMTFNSIIQSHAPQGHSSEVCWAIWGCILFGVKIVDESVRTLIAMSDPIAALLGLHAQNLGLLPKADSLKHFRQFLTEEDLSGEHWILAYEANIKGWLSSPTGKNHVAEDPLFSILKGNGVTFYDESKVEEAFHEAAEAISEAEDEPGVGEGYF